MTSESKQQELFRLAGSELDGEETSTGEAVEPEGLLPVGTVEIGGRVYPEPTCYAYVLLERVASGRLPYELTSTERGLYLLWVVRHQDRPAELAALTQRPITEAELARFATEYSPEELYLFATEYLRRVVGAVKKKALRPPAIGSV
jgi:hypothetical protein